MAHDNAAPSFKSAAGCFRPSLPGFVVVVTIQAKLNLIEIFSSAAPTIECPHLKFGDGSVPPSSSLLARICSGPLSPSLCLQLTSSIFVVVPIASLGACIPYPPSGRISKRIHLDRANAMREASHDPNFKRPRDL